MTSAERVAYREQRASDGRVSGKFRSTLMDVFAKEFPKEKFWKVIVTQLAPEIKSEQYHDAGVV